MTRALVMLFLVALGFAPLRSASADERPADVTLTGTFTGADLETYRELPIAVPRGTERLTIEYAYQGHTGRPDQTTVTLGLKDPQRFRGTSGADKDRVVLEEADATPSYLPGPIPAGTWRVVLGVNHIAAGATSAYTVKIWFDHVGTPFPGFSPAPIKAGLAWYRGDLHMHTAHSDGTCRSDLGKRVPCPVFKTLEAAHAQGLDFIAVTDHNAVTQAQDLRELAPYFDDLLLIPGREITMFAGHANVFGPTRYLDYRVGFPGGLPFAKLLDEVTATGGIISVNHPGAEPDCFGCPWLMQGVDYDRVQAVEAVNGGSMNDTGSPEKRSSFPFWEAWLNDGHRITGIGGSDNHNGTQRIETNGEGVGRPTTVVHAVELSQPAILDGIRRGRVFVDVQGSRDRLLEVEAQAGGVRAEMGDVLRASAGARVVFSVHVAGAPEGAKLSLVGDAAGLARLADQHLAAGENRAVFELTADGRAHWLRVDVRDAKGQLILIGNPIYLRPAA